ncbi:hypothetical protein SAMD00019534_053600 [Acytostelium subglobosum LB1]|uniref:hypothetical protein n=1 Tax=Acytostelium subglobosum LB1 TaxID=1410327 RepID=UPI000644F60D|nr:hypothetical protein SAMD00019534_053600 [Acytostelium subglobosum LB1]GAM22185.1 hypothetical protein SAMD00019534_053600 [Acytostelium subglobosum LB1]|eukprot:XP_012755285.1 hypothetical protein SAMD00019534_053600 [Acytostelium subglobosum LB1]
MPPSLVSLHLGNERRFSYELVVGSLPNSLTELSYSPSYSQPCDPSVLPRSLTSITLGYGALIQGEYPTSLRHLVFQYHNNFDQDIIPNIPSLRSLVLVLDKDIALGMIPSTITSLKLPRFRMGIESRALPSSLTELVLDDTFDLSKLRAGILPESLKRLKLKGPPFSSKSASKMVLPGGLTHLTMAGLAQLEYVPAAAKVAHVRVGLQLGSGFRPVMSPLLAPIGTLSLAVDKHSNNLSLQYGDDELPLSMDLCAQLIKHAIESVPNVDRYTASLKHPPAKARWCLVDEKHAIACITCKGVTCFKSLAYK